MLPPPEQSVNICGKAEKQSPVFIELEKIEKENEAMRESIRELETRLYAILELSEDCKSVSGESKLPSTPEKLNVKLVKIGEKMASNRNTLQSIISRLHI